MSNLYDDVERSIQQTLKAAITAAGLPAYDIFTSQVTKKDFGNHHASLSIMKISDTFAPENGGGTAAYIKTPVFADPSQNPPVGFGVGGFGQAPFGQSAVDHYTVQDWPDPFNLLYALTVSAESTGVPSQVGYVTGLKHVRALDALIRQAFRPRRRMMIWDSTLNNNAGGFSTNYCNYQYAGYINRDVPDEEMYVRVTNLRFEVFNYNETVTVEPVIKYVPTLTVDVVPQS